MDSCLMVRGPKFGTKNRHSQLEGMASGTKSLSITPRSCENVDRFRDLSLTKPIFALSVEALRERTTLQYISPSSSSPSVDMTESTTAGVFVRLDEFGFRAVASDLFVGLLSPDVVVARRAFRR